MESEQDSGVDGCSLSTVASVVQLKSKVLQRRPLKSGIKSGQSCQELPFRSKLHKISSELIVNK